MQQALFPLLRKPDIPVLLLRFRNSATPILNVGRVRGHSGLTEDLRLPYPLSGPRVSDRADHKRGGAEFVAISQRPRPRLGHPHVLITH